MTYGILGSGKFFLSILKFVFRHYVAQKVRPKFIICISLLVYQLVKIKLGLGRSFELKYAFGNQ